MLEAALVCGSTTLSHLKLMLSEPRPVMTTGEEEQRLSARAGEEKRRAGGETRNWESSATSEARDS